MANVGTKHELYIVFVSLYVEFSFMKHETVNKCQADLVVLQIFVLYLHMMMVTRNMEKEKRLQRKVNLVHSFRCHIGFKQISN